jgi:DNA modification methylase
MLLPVKTNGDRESVEDRTTHDYGWNLVFTKQRRYFWNKDAIRVPLAKGRWPQKRGKYRGGVIRGDKARDVRVAPNPNGRNASSVLEFNAANRRGKPPATISKNLAHWILSAARDDNAHVCDPFGRAATFAIIALQMGHRATTIDINLKYTMEAIERLSNAPAKLPVDHDKEGNWAWRSEQQGYRPLRLPMRGGRWENSFAFV